MNSRVNSFIAWAAANSFLLALISGVFLAFPFRVEMPLISTVGIEGVLPFGDFVRGLHFYTGQLAFLFLLLHIVYSLRARSFERKSWFSWSLLVATFPLTVFALFSGYVVRNDEIGSSAGHIAESLLLEVPLIGNFLNHLLMAVSKEGVHRVYAAHFCISFLLFIGLCGWHFNLKRLKIWDLVYVALVAMILTVFYPPLLRPFEPDLSVLGPWFFVGIQELLRHLPPFWAGVVFPSIPVAALWAYKKYSKLAGIILVAWHVFYFFLSLVGFSR
ncbi:cytochrome b N-terminal domain-containing protein [Thermodesulfatator autotrophicus]|uniref:Cytochrome b/b6 N-terminal region profile domain-containing protein n=1 Tax=Thermodesulfatator autotrophicus TaxID=1795632 RepID=A0A177E7D5_9BACT|nr:cytochrome b N-terminal domain-containing protein [Thermodesulfatator autotrophicus]OAG27411.1 hypothetical protein TH606_07000 [Thermodesulfatator autotrophicus]